MLATVSAIVSMLFVATLLAQATPASGAEPAIPPVVWELVELTAPSHGLLEIAEPGRYTVQFQAEARLVVEAGCNQVAGSYTAGNGVMDVSVSDSTLARCPSDSHSKPFLEQLAKRLALRVGRAARERRLAHGNVHDPVSGGVPPGDLVAAGLARQPAFGLELHGVARKLGDLPQTMTGCGQLY